MAYNNLQNMLIFVDGTMGMFASRSTAAKALSGHASDFS